MVGGNIHKSNYKLNNCQKTWKSMQGTTCWTELFGRVFLLQCDLDPLLKGAFAKTILLLYAF